MKPTLFFVAGPTAVGKSEVVLHLAERIHGEIISVDSMQVYRGMDIGTAKPGPEQLKRVPHHLLDVVDVDQLFDAARFVSLTCLAVSEIQRGGRIPIFCGGTGLYFQAYLRGLGDAPPADAAMRAELEQQPLSDLLQELEQRDPDMARIIDKKNPRRVIRALEVIRLTGKPYSSQRAKWDKATLPEGLRAFGISRSSADLQRRINQRVDQMFARGLVQETEALLRQGLARNPTALQALGYRQVVEYLQGKRSLPETVELTKIRTRQFAKRQLTWFKKYAPLTWIHAGPGDSPEDLASLLLAG